RALVVHVSSFRAPTITHTNFQQYRVQKYREVHRKEKEEPSYQSPVSSSSVFPEAEQWRWKKRQQRQLMQTNFVLRVRLNSTSLWRPFGYTFGYSHKT
ncbi:hypothetical protein M5D96_005085, partial [Drosophila gunungcola]